MSELLFVTTVVLDIVGFVFATVYICLNSFSRITDLNDRNADILKITRSSVALSLIFALLSCLLSDKASIASSFSRAGTLYTVIAVSCLAVVLECGAALLVLFIKKAPFKVDLLKSTKKMFRSALFGAIIAIVCAWLLS